MGIYQISPSGRKSILKICRLIVAGNKVATQNKPTAALVLVLIGGIFTLLGGIAVAIIGSAVTFFLSGIGATLGLIGIISGIIMIVAAVLMNNTDISKVHMWSIIALIFTIIGLANGGGFIIGFILGLIGSILGLVYKG